MSSQFIRTKEDFVCQKCGFSVEGNGYTNHCAECLWSKHVDVFPGDRAETCGGMMEPIAVLKKGDEYIITHKCVKCGAEKKNKAVREDNFQMLVQISAENSEKFLYPVFIIVLSELWCSNLLSGVWLKGERCLFEMFGQSFGYFGRENLRERCRVRFANRGLCMRV